MIEENFKFEINPKRHRPHEDAWLRVKSTGMLAQVALGPDENLNYVIESESIYYIVPHDDVDYLITKKFKDIEKDELFAMCRGGQWSLYRKMNEHTRTPIEIYKEDGLVKYRRDHSRDDRVTIHYETCYPIKLTKKEIKVTEIGLPESIQDFEMWAQGHFFIVNKAKNRIELPHVGESIIFHKGTWFSESNHYIYRIEKGEELTAWLKAREVFELGALFVMDRHPEYTEEILAYMADTEMSVTDLRVVEKLEELMYGLNSNLATLAAAVFRTCVKPSVYSDLSNDKAEEEA